MIAGKQNSERLLHESDEKHKHEKEIDD